MFVPSGTTARMLQATRQGGYPQSRQSHQAVLIVSQDHRRTLINKTHAQLTPAWYCRMGREGRREKSNDARKTKNLRLNYLPLVNLPHKLERNPTEHAALAKAPGQSKGGWTCEHHVSVLLLQVSGTKAGVSVTSLCFPSLSGRPTDS